VDAIQLIEKLAAGGFATFLVAILIAGKYRVWVWGYHLDDAIRDREKQITYERAEKDQWRQLAMEGKNLTDRSVALASTVVKQAV
jgi:hypothetical protein